MRYVVFGVPGLPEVSPGDDLAALIDAALAGGDPVTLADGDIVTLADGDIVVVTSKVVSKAEGRVVRAADEAAREAAIDAESVRTVASWPTPRGVTRVVATRHGFVLAAAGVDASNTEPGTLVLLPLDPDGSARRIRAGLRARQDVRVGVVVTDTFGRPWRDGQTDVAIGAAGLRPVLDLRGSTDAYGNSLGVTVAAVADELAGAAELVKGKLGGVPVAVVRGLSHLVTDDDGPGAAALVRPVEQDMFALGTREARRDGAELAAAGVPLPPAPAPADVPALLSRLVAAAADLALKDGVRLVVDGSEVRAVVADPSQPRERQLLAAGAALATLRVRLAAAGVASEGPAVVDLPAPEGRTSVNEPALAVLRLG